MKSRPAFMRRFAPFAAPWTPFLSLLMFLPVACAGSSPEGAPTARSEQSLEGELRDDANAKSIASIWAVNDGEKVDRDDLSNPNKHFNSAWTGHTIRIFGARNEVVAFQVVVETGKQGIAALTAQLPELRCDAQVIRYVPPSDDPANYTDRSIQVFAENYMTVTRRTFAYWIYHTGSASEPADALGPKPVQLVPENAAKGGFPLTVGPKQNQAFWFEIYIPKQQAKGDYRGEVIVTADGSRQRIPIELEVLDFTLPDENSLTAMVYYEPSQVERYQGRNLDPTYHRFAHRHRVEFVHGYGTESAGAARTRFTGEDFMRSAGYEGPGMSVGNTLVPRTFYGPEPDFDTPEEAAANSKPWTDWLAQNLPGKRTFVYMPDEPAAEQFPFIRSLANAVHGTGAPLPVLVTHAYDAQLDGADKAIDIWAATADSYDIARADALRAEGREMLPYNGQRPNIGAVVIDSPATDPRATMWAAFKHGVRTYFYWHANHWRHNRSAAPTWDRDQNIWAEPITFNNKLGTYANGDGVLVYPGQEILHPAEDRGIVGPVGTIQLANMRRGLQDHLYLTLAKRRGLGFLADAMVRRIVPKVFSDAHRDDKVSFPENGDDYEFARRFLGHAIAHAGGR